MRLSNTCKDDGLIQRLLRNSPNPTFFVNGNYKTKLKVVYKFDKEAEAEVFKYFKYYTKCRNILKK
jgi:hypothetical protein